MHPALALKKDCVGEKFACRATGISKEMRIMFNIKRNANFSQCRKSSPCQKILPSRALMKYICALGELQPFVMIQPYVKKYRNLPKVGKMEYLNRLTFSSSLFYHSVWRTCTHNCFNTLPLLPLPGEHTVMEYTRMKVLRGARRRHAKQIPKVRYKLYVLPAFNLAIQDHY